MTTRNSLVPAVLAAAIGAALWFAVAGLTGKREPWDDSIYWTLAFRPPSSPSPCSPIATPTVPGAGR